METLSSLSTLTEAAERNTSNTDPVAALILAEGLGTTDAGFGGLGGLTAITTRASNYRKQTSLSYAFSNRSYNHRVMASVGTGEMGKGWYMMASASGRYAGEGYTEGTFYQAYSYFLSLEKKINSKHSLNLTVFGAPSQRGGSAPVVQEAYDLVGSNFYNPNWVGEMLFLIDIQDNII